jgi:hypothetical protein
MGMGPIGGILGYVLAPVLPLTEEKMRESNPDMKTVFAPAQRTAPLRMRIKNVILQGTKGF